MDARRNPYAPGAGTPPPELAGRDGIIERAAVALDRICEGRSARSLIFYGLRGVGKTVLLNRIRWHFPNDPLQARIGQLGHCAGGPWRE
jgi:Cdc6-like AAA superfamily ATPase